MSLQMEKEQSNDPVLLQAVLQFLETMPTKHAPEQIVLDAFRTAFQSGGLDGVDDLIKTLNISIKASGGQIGFGDGAALEHSDGERPAFLHIFYVEFKTERVIVRESIALKPGTAPAPD